MILLGVFTKTMWVVEHSGFAGAAKSEDGIGEAEERQDDHQRALGEKRQHVESGEDDRTKGAAAGAVMHDRQPLNRERGKERAEQRRSEGSNEARPEQESQQSGADQQNTDPARASAAASHISGQGRGSRFDRNTILAAV